MNRRRTTTENLFLAFESDPIWNKLLTHRIKLNRENPKFKRRNTSDRPHEGILDTILYTVNILRDDGFKFYFTSEDQWNPVLDISDVVNIRSYQNLLQAINANPTKEWIIIPET
jgi:hypothetical protein